MNIESLNIPSGDLKKILSAANGDAALLYLYLRSGGERDPREALGLEESQYGVAEAVLRQLGLWPEEKSAVLMPGERPRYTEQDLLAAMDTDASFRSLYGEVQRLLGRSLNTEELKILLGFVRYLGLPAEVISVLVCYCKERARRRGSLRNPSLRTIEKEAYAWAEAGIDTVEAAAAFIQTQNQRESKLGRLAAILQIRGRSLTAAETRYAQSWLDMDFDQEALTMAYERTCLNTGGLNWNYMNKILLRWHEAGLHTGAQVRSGDARKDGSTERRLDSEEQAAIARMLREG